MAQVILQARSMDYGLVSIDTECDCIYVCPQEPDTFANASADALGYKAASAGSIFAAPQNGAGGGRTVTSIAVNNGTITSSGTATHLAFVDQTNSRLLVVAPLPAPVAVYAGEVWSLDAVTVHLFN